MITWLFALSEADLMTLVFVSLVMVNSPLLSAESERSLNAALPEEFIEATGSFHSVLTIRAELVASLISRLS